MNAGELDPRQEAEVLRRRASQLARAAAPVPDDLLEVLQFGAAGQPCALELAWLREVRPLSTIAPLPFARPGVLGVTHLRGRMLPVLALAHLLGLGGSADGAAKLLVLGDAATQFGVAVDDAVTLGTLRLSGLQRDAAVMNGVAPDLVRGVAADARILLEAATLLARGAAYQPQTS